MLLIPTLELVIEVVAIPRDSMETTFTKGGDGDR